MVKKLRKVHGENQQVSSGFTCGSNSSRPPADIFKIFSEVQWTDAFHEKYIRQLTTVYENVCI